MKHNANMNYIDGIPAFTARKICKFAFSQYFFRLQVDHINKRFHVYLYEGVDSEVVSYFQKFFGNRYIITILPQDRMYEVPTQRTIN